MMSERFSSVRCLTSMFAAGALLACPVVMPLHAQDHAVTTPIRNLRLVVSDERKIQGFPGITFSFPVRCSPEGNMLVQPATLTAGLDPVMVSPEGEIKARFGREAVAGLRNPDVLGTFLRGDDVYLLLTGAVELDHTIEVSTPTGQLLQQKAIQPSTRLAHYRPDGALATSFQLDVPFKPERFGVFEDGSLLVAGVAAATNEVKAAILDAGGQLLRMIDLDFAAAEKMKSRSRNKPRQQAPFLGSEIMQDGPDLLVFERGRNTILFVNASGTVRTLALHPYRDYQVEEVFSSQGQLVAGLSHGREEAGPRQFVSISVDRRTGRALSLFRYPENLADGFSCASEEKYEFIRVDGEGKAVELIHAFPEHR